MKSLRIQVLHNLYDTHRQIPGIYYGFVVTSKLRDIIFLTDGDFSPEFVCVYNIELF